MLKNWKIFNKNVEDRSPKSGEQQTDCLVETSEVGPMSGNNNKMQSQSQENEERKERIEQSQKPTSQSEGVSHETEKNKKEENKVEENVAANREESSNVMDDLKSALNSRMKRTSSLDIGMFRNMAIKDADDQRSLLRMVKYLRHVDETEEIKDKNEGNCISDEEEVQDIDRHAKLDLAEEVIYLKFEIAQCRGDLDQQCLLSRKLTEERLALTNVIESVTNERNELFKENEQRTDEIAELQTNYLDGTELQKKLEEVQHKLESSDAKNKELEEFNKDQLETISNFTREIKVITTEKEYLQNHNKHLEQEVDNYVAQDTLVNELKENLDKALCENYINLRLKTVLEEEQSDDIIELEKLRVETKANTTTISEVEMKLAQVDSERTSLVSDYLELKEEESRLVYDLQRCKEENLQLYARLELLHTPANPYRKRNSAENSDAFSFIPNLNSSAVSRDSERYDKIEEGLSVLL